MITWLYKDVATESMLYVSPLEEKSSILENVLPTILLTCSK